MTAETHLKWNQARWILNAKIHDCAAHHKKIGLLFLACGIIVTIIGFLFLMGIATFAVFHFKNEHEIILSTSAVISCGVVTGMLGTSLLFITYNPHSYGDLTELSSPSEESLFAAIDGRVGKQNLAQLVGAWLYGGPHLISKGRRRIEKSRRLLTADIDGCSAVLHLLYSAGHRISYSDLTKQITGLDHVNVFNQLRDIDGILFLESNPPGMSLGTPLRKDLHERFRTTY